MENKKRVYCLYRVSTRAQVNKDDIPMQKQACREFAESQNWEIVNEFYEKGVSGFKVSSKDRDAILEIQQDAAMGKFDILLVFMFDRLGRRDDETPFVVEWFIRNNIEVWSVNEGEQRLDSHVDKLMNYIRYWQASGESIKSSIRVKTRIAQIVQEGHYAGGPAPFGYRLVKSGRVNSKGIETKDFVVDDESAQEIVKLIFSKYVSEGYGSTRIVDYLTEQVIRRSNGKPFSRCVIDKMLQNELYIGYLHYGETKTYVPTLQILDNDTFNRALEIRAKRRKTYAPERRIPMTTKAESLLSGNVFCGNCGRRLTFSPTYMNYKRKDGSITKYRAPAYSCTRGNSLEGVRCQRRYSSPRIDDTVRSILQRVFEQIRETPPADCWKRQHERHLSDIKRKVKTATNDLSKSNKELSAYKSEVIKVIQGESAFDDKTLNQLISDSEDKVSKQSEELDRLKIELAKSDSFYEKVKEEHMRIRTWSEIFDDSSLETQKMVATSLIKEVRMNRDYQMEIDFNISVKEFVDDVSFEADNISVSVES